MFDPLFKNLHIFAFLERFRKLSLHYSSVKATVQEYNFHTQQILTSKNLYYLMSRTE